MSVPEHTFREVSCEKMSMSVFFGWDGLIPQFVFEIMTSYATRKQMTYADSGTMKRLCEEDPIGSVV